MGRDFFLRGCVALGVTTAVLTELLSPLHLLRRGPLLFAWIAVLTLGALRFSARLKLPRTAIRPVEGALALAGAAIVAIVAVTAILSPPNSADAMAYHMPRVVYWAQAGSVAFFPPRTSTRSASSRWPNTSHCTATCFRAATVSSICSPAPHAPLPSRESQRSPARSARAPADRPSRRSFAPRCPTESCKLPAPRMSGCWPCGSSAPGISFSAKTLHSRASRWAWRWRRKPPRTCLRRRWSPPFC